MFLFFPNLSTNQQGILKRIYTAVCTFKPFTSGLYVVLLASIVAPHNLPT